MNPVWWIAGGAVALWGLLGTVRDIVTYPRSEPGKILSRNSVAVAIVAFAIVFIMLQSRAK